MLRFIIDALATWRVANLLVNENGPWYVFKHIRESFGFLYYDDGTVLARPDNHVLSCVWCCSIWVGVVVPFLPYRLRWLLSLSTVACVLDQLKDYVDGNS